MTQNVENRKVVNIQPHTFECEFKKYIQGSKKLYRVSAKKTIYYEKFFLKT
jgi:hypothetical protein